MTTTQVLPSGRTRIIEWSPAWDKRDPNPKKDCGIHGMELRFVLKGKDAAAQFVVFTNWMLPHLRSRVRGGEAWMFEPLPADVGYHAISPQYEGQESITPSCPYLDGRPCFYDGSGLAAEALFDRFVAEGEGAVWNALDERLDEIEAKGAK